MYIYSRATLERHYKVFDEAWSGQPHLVCYAMKALSNLAVLRLLARLGAGFDIVSIGELRRVIAAGGDPARVVFSGVGKRKDEMAAALQAGIKCFNVESEAELVHLDDVARAHGVTAPISMRINPDVDAQTHPYISTGLAKNKFGIPQARARAAYAKAGDLAGLEVVGLDYHIGSQLAQVEPMVEACRRVLGLMHQLVEDGHTMHHLDVGGGLGITYRDEAPPSPAEYANTLKAELHAAGHQDLTILTEPGRVIVGNAGVMLMRVLLTKDNGVKRFTIVDAAMNDAIRPALYDAYHGLEPVAGRDQRGPDHRRRGRPGLRERRLLRPGSRPAAPGRRRPAGHAQRRCLRLRDGQQLQLAAPSRRGHRGRRHLPRGPAARIHRRPVARRDDPPGLAATEIGCASYAKNAQPRG